MSNGSMTEGTAHRTGVRRTPVIHLLVPGADGWAMWCSGSKGREDNPHGNRRCSKCLALAAEAAARRMYSASELGRFAPDGYSDEDGEDG